jgi:hypothetical protein
VDPDPHHNNLVSRKIKNLNPDPHQGEKSNPDPHHGDADPQHWLKKGIDVMIILYWYLPSAF